MKISDSDIDRILENLIQIMPLLHKKLLRMDLGGIDSGLTRLHFSIMGKLMQNSMTATDLAKDSVVPKSQMTHLLDKLVALGIVERQPAAYDRRVINLNLTNYGKTFLKDLRAKVRENIKKRLTNLTADELAEMSRALETIKAVGCRL